MRPITNIRKAKTIWALIIGITFSSYCFAENDVPLFMKNFEHKGDQIVLTGHIDSLRIVRDEASFYLGPGHIALFNFGWDRPSAMVYGGSGVFSYSPPDHVELGQLLKFTDQPMFNNVFQSSVFFFTLPIAGLLDKSSLTRMPVPDWAWDKLSDARNDAFGHLLTYIPNEMFADLLSGGEGKYFYAAFDLDGVGPLVLEENPAYDDWYTLYKLNKRVGIDDEDIISGWSPDDLLPTQRGVMPIDIYHYDIDSRIEAGGKMMVNCRLHFVPLLPDNEFLYFFWYHENKVLSAYDSDKNLLFPVYKKEGAKVFGTKNEESGLGLVLNRPMVVGDSDYVDIEFECKSLEKFSTLFFISGRTYWYPKSIFQDNATYSLRYDCPKKYEVISCGKNISSRIEDGRQLTHFELDRPSNYISFNVGSFRKKEIMVEGYPPVQLSLVKEVADISSQGSDILLSKDRLGQAGADVMNSLAFFTSMFGPCPFDTLHATSKPRGGQGSPGVIYLSWKNFLTEDMEGYAENLRSHEVSHQWWGHVIDNESYRDTWIIEGLAEYCGLWFYEMSVKDRGKFSKMLKDYRGFIKSGSGRGSEGCEAGPMSIGYRLNSTKSRDKTSIVYFKGSYVFHMIRYLLHDYKTGSDDKFASFLKDLVEKFQDTPITTRGFKTVLEAHVGGDMTWFFDQWVYGTYIPKYSFKYETEETEDGKYKVSCLVKQKDVPGDFKMLVPIAVLFDEDRYIHLKIWVDKPETVIDLPLLPYEPKDVVFNTYDAVLCR
ncbi:MAG: M1 family metallopeptidase [candidate division Zixibacteria bacterium]|nr:M1 family metallopeptidase [candidate division Zixibacteria bacterium]